MRRATINVKLSEYEIAEVEEIYAELRSYAATSRATNISASTVSRIIRGLGKYGELQRDV